MSVVSLSIVIVNWNTCQLLRDCLESLRAAEGSDHFDVVVVDNASADGSAEMVEREFSAVRLIRNEQNEGYARANNLGIRAARGRYVWLLNSDTRVPPATPAALLRFFEQTPAAGACSPRLVRPDGRPQTFAFGGDPTLGYLLRRGWGALTGGRPLHDWGTDRISMVDWVSGAALLARREALDDVGLLDERFFMYFEDNDLCLRIRQQGWRIYYAPAVSITHLGGQSLARNPAAARSYYQSLDYFYAKHYGPLRRTLLRVLLAPYRWTVERRIRSNR